MDEGMIYVMGRCKPGHQPIIVVSGQRFHNSKNQDLKLLDNYLCFTFDWVWRNMCVTGKIESWFILLDLEDVTVATVPVGKVKAFA
tara:strand:+ start:452 stop:709 length:258 start_codon:yes stop_codon:yes gene_type:complete